VSTSTNPASRRGWAANRSLTRSRFMVFLPILASMQSRRR
jgi:hypothetical protein